MTNYDYADEVAAGLALLDEKLDPDWDQRVSISRLYMRDEHDCVAAQALGVPFYRTWPKLGITVRNGNADHAELRRYGLTQHPDDGAFSDRLTTAWRAALTARRVERTKRKEK